MINATPLPHQRVDVLGKQMAYVDVGDGAADRPTIVFQHGNPTSSYLWRNIMPYAQSFGRCVAIDLIGMGHSDKLDGDDPLRYGLASHQRYFDAALDALGIADQVVFVIHDWGSALGFDWANRHRDAVLGICYMEAIVRPMTWDEWPDAATKIFQGFRSDAGEDMVLKNNVFVERVLPGSIIRDLSEEEMAIYRAPFLKPGEDRRPTLTWPRQIPLAGEPEDVVEIVQAYGAWLSQSAVPKLFINAEPGAILTGKQRETCRAWPNQTEVTVKGAHFIQEDSPDEIGTALKDWLTKILSA